MYSKSVKQTEDDIQAILKRVNELSGIKESDTGLAPPALWDLAADKQTLQSNGTIYKSNNFDVHSAYICYLKRRLELHAFLLFMISNGGETVM